MDKIGTKQTEELLSSQVTQTRYFFLDLAPTRRRGVAVALGGRERCNPDYLIRRDGYSYHGIEYVAEGVGEVTLDGARSEVKAGSMFAYAPSMRCEIRTDPKRPMLKYFICLVGDGVVKRLARAGVTPGKAIALTPHAEIRGLAEDLVNEGRRSGPLAREICAQLLELWLLKIEDLRVTGGQGDPVRETFLRCKTLIDAGPERLHTLREIAAAAAMEESSVCRLFRRYQGTSPYQYLLRRKMNLAAGMLMDGSGLVKEVAQRMGFADPYHFSRCFKAVHGVAPKQLLKHGRTPAPERPDAR